MFAFKQYLLSSFYFSDAFFLKFQPAFSLLYINLSDFDQTMFQNLLHTTNFLYYKAVAACTA